MNKNPLRHSAGDIANIWSTLRYAEEHLSRAEYNKVASALKRFFAGAIALSLVLAAVIGFLTVFLLSSGVSSTTDICEGFAGADSCKSGWVDYDDNAVYTYDSQTYTVPLVEYGLDPEELEPNDKLMVYFDADRNLIGVTDGTEKPTGLPPYDYWVFGEAIATFVIILVYSLIASKTFAKDYFTFAKKYREKA